MNKQDCLSGNGRPPANNSVMVGIHLFQIAKPCNTQTRFYCFCDLDLDLHLSTLIYEIDLKILKVYFNTKHELSRPRLSEFRALQTDRQM